MRKSKFSESKIVTLLKEAEAGRKVSEICREQGVIPRKIIGVLSRAFYDQRIRNDLCRSHVLLKARLWRF